MPIEAAGFNTTELHSEKFFDTMDRYMGACIGVIAIRTRELERCKTLLHEWASMREMDFNLHNPITGWAKYKQIPVVRSETDTRERPALKPGDEVMDYMQAISIDVATIPPDKALATFAERAKNKDNLKNRFCGVFMAPTADFLNHAVFQQHVRDIVQRAYTSDDRMVLILPPTLAIPENISNEIELIDLQTPSFAELLENINDMDSNIQEETEVTLSDEDKALVVQNALGMTQQEFENAISLAIVDVNRRLKREGEAADEVSVDEFVKVVRERKLEILKQTKVLELMSTSKVSDVGGLDLLKAYLVKRAKAFTPQAKAMGIKPPKGIIVVGPPGGGKTLITQVVCDIFGQAGIRFDISRIFGQFIGQSEGAMRMALSMIEDMAPCVVQIDEIEKALAGTGGDSSGTTTRVFGQLLTWMQDRTDRGIPVTIVATANDVTKIPPEMMRKGRFDAIFGITFPTMQEREAILDIHVRKRGHTLTSEEILRLAKATDTFVGAELEACVEEALFEDLDAGWNYLTVGAMMQAIEETTPQVKVFPERIAQMKEFCEKNARPASSESTWDISQEEKPGIARVQRPRGRNGTLKLRSSSS